MNKIIQYMNNYLLVSLLFCIHYIIIKPKVFNSIKNIIKESIVIYILVILHLN